MYGNSRVFARESHWFLTLHLNDHKRWDQSTITDTISRTLRPDFPIRPLAMSSVVYDVQ